MVPVGGSCQASCARDLRDLPGLVLREGMALLRVALIVVGLAAACGKGSGTASPPAHKDDAAAPAARDAPARLELPPRALGLPELAAFQWRKRPGQATYKLARKAEDHGDWEGVVAACRQTLADDPGHLEAAWLLAAALGKLDRREQILEPLALAVAGEFGRWSQASLDLPALQGFLSTPAGQAWRRRIASDRAVYLAALARSTIVVADRELYAFDPQAARWHRLTRTGGAVIGALAGPAHQLAYVTRRGPKGNRQLAVGVVDLGTGHTGRAAPIGIKGPITVAYSARAPVGFYVATGVARPGAARSAWHLVGNGKLDALPANTARPPGRRLEVAGHVVRLSALPIAKVTADWDEQGLASAMRIGSSNKVVTVPSPGLIDGNTVVWSPDHTKLAFIAQLQPDATCTPGLARAAAYTADAATGAVQLVFTPVLEPQHIDTGLSVEWMADRTLVVAGGDGVTMIKLDGLARTPLPGATELVTPRPRPRCTPPPADDDVEDPEPTETSPAGGGGSGSTMVGPP